MGMGQGGQALRIHRQGCGQAVASQGLWIAALERRKREWRVKRVEMFRVPFGAIWQQNVRPGLRRPALSVRTLPMLARQGPHPPAIALENGDAVAVAVGRPLRVALAKTSLN
ncbi:hypothetical protein B0T20DRAFT_491618 [Sordaria brevicollis]|uniref:Uncharacterized protein n=1 Tax=Sordaria brevicollis TaxID=83679 RepID=A0AAE0U230_SORBR|nr:hypothetical protein B0T20DRAFT_491618 [Sordaria brevicollis]